MAISSFFFIFDEMFRNYFKTVEKMQKNFERDASANRFDVENENLEVRIGAPINSCAFRLLNNMIVI